MPDKFSPARYLIAGPHYTAAHLFSKERLSEKRKHIGLKCPKCGKQELLSKKPEPPNKEKMKWETFISKLKSEAEEREKLYKNPR